MQTHSQNPGAGNIPFIYPPPNIMDPRLPYESWREGQQEIIEVLTQWLQGPNRFLGLEAPTGMGKSLISVALGLVGGRETAILTHSLALQDQLAKDFPVAIRDIRGMSHSPCLVEPPGWHASEGKCQIGDYCPLKASGCAHFDSFRWARRGQVLSTNYAMMLTHSTGQRTDTRDGTEDLGYRELLICDEAHMAFSAIVSHVELKLNRYVLEGCGVQFPESGFNTRNAWQDWVESRLEDVKIGAGMHTSRREKSRARVAFELSQQMEQFVKTSGTWAWERSDDYNTWVLTPVWPAEHSRKLWGHPETGAPSKILLMSASLTERTLDLLGVPWRERSWHSAPSTFPAENTPIRYISTVDVTYKSFHGPNAEANIAHWVSRIDQIIASRPGKKGLIFTVSYDRQQLIVERSRHPEVLFWHFKGLSSLKDSVSHWRQANYGAVLVSPTATSGWDFPEADYIIIAKIPYPVTQKGAPKIRAQEDKEWASYVAMETIVQAAGGGTRSAQDKCEVFIIDDQWRWLWRKAKELDLAPKWFRARVDKKTWEYVPPMEESR